MAGNSVALAVLWHVGFGSWPWRGMYLVLVHPQLSLVCVCGYVYAYVYTYVSYVSMRVRVCDALQLKPSRICPVSLCL